jgi:hypothetical protein
VPAATPHPTAHTVPPPVLFNAWKHHAGWVREQIASAADEGEGGLAVLAGSVVVTGTKLMDFYTGRLTPWEVGERVLSGLRDGGRLDRDPFAAWVGANDGYRVVEMPDDGSRWVLRLGHGERYVHLHTARYSPHSIRVPGVSLKTAIVANALARTRGRPVADLAAVNEARRRFLGLPPMARLTDEGGLGEVLRLLAAVG